MPRISLLGLMGLFLVAPSLSAGLYVSSDPLEPAKDLGSFLVQLSDLRGYGPPDGVTMKEPTEQRKAILAKVEALRAKPRLTTAERADLGAYLLRLWGRNPGAPDFLSEALEVLQAAHRDAPNDFQTAANLGTAYHLVANLGPTAHPYGGEVGLRQAERYLDTAVSLAPTEALRQAERFHLRLVQLRAEEMRQPGTGSNNPFNTPQPDPLFRVRFVGPSGKWEVGNLAAEERARLPENALQLLQRLLMTLPSDDRLQWLLAELANAQGDTIGIRVASLLYPQTVPEFRRRRASLQEAATWRTLLDRAGAPTAQVLLAGEILSGGTRGMLPGLDAATALAATAAGLPKPPGFLDPFAEEGPAGPAPIVAFANWSWRTWAIVGLGACVIVVLLYFQLSELRRRRLRGSRRPA